ncbi:MAG: AbrB/MazE/SpoVT family DNA-binding domain-containing protein [Gemmatimonadetes bacterium]|jgi:AbrB family looped-hinge helix DNA binding protein|nr:AbrB/MazE/SpoVT family DNA-binding domain-containing protein [Gemmatimonadota bacterium]MBT7862901.1 AbrB/MazE/SpoVT family DNA-binding domain-containing protein [Gemmatimonadota bacterium]
MEAKLTSKGQVTVPKSCRDQLGLKPGTLLDFEVVDGVLTARKVQVEDVYRKWRGAAKLPDGMNVDEYLRQVRG